MSARSIDVSFPLAYLALTIAGIGALSGCRAGSESDEANADTLSSRAEIMSMAYDRDYAVPVDFFRDERADTTETYTVHHVLDETGSYELCTDDYLEAYAWEAADNDTRSVNGLFVGLFENDKYFEIIRELEYTQSIGNVAAPSSPGFSRIFKCRYADRREVLRSARNGFAGYLNERPLSVSVVREFVEYLWQFTFFWPREKTVLRSATIESADAFDHELLIAFVTRNGLGDCDLVELVEWTFSVSKPDGRIERRFEVVDAFGAIVVSGVPRLCPE